MRGSVFISLILFAGFFGPFAYGHEPVQFYSLSRVCSDGSQPKDSLIDDATTLALTTISRIGEISVVFRNDVGDVCVRNTSVHLQNGHLSFYPTPLVRAAECSYTGKVYSFNLDLFRSASYPISGHDGNILISIPPNQSGNSCPSGQSLEITFTPLQR